MPKTFSLLHCYACSPVFGWKAEFLFYFISFLASRKGSTEKVPKLGGVFFGTCVLKSKCEACFQIWPPGSPSNRRSQMERSDSLFVCSFVCKCTKQTAPCGVCRCKLYVRERESPCVSFTYYIQHQSVGKSRPDLARLCY